jgi:hypothetical protein
MAVKRYDGSAWQTVAGLGAQGAAATSSSIATWVKTASGGETSLSGNDDSSQALSYTVGQELVFINGTLLKRGSDYTATNGTSITGLTALAANDVATVWTVNAFSVTGAIANTIVDAKGDLIVATGADTPGRLAVGTNGQYLKADSTTGTGLAWATFPSSGKVLQVVTGTTTTEVTSSTNTKVSTGITASITPSATSSKVLILCSAMFQKSAGTQTNRVSLNITRGATEIYIAENITYNNTAVETFSPWAATYLDSPSTTSSTTYTVNFANAANAASVAVNRSGSTGSIVLLEIGA